MDGISPTTRTRRRPLRGLTLADCGLIVLGAALALALPFPDYWMLPDPSPGAAMRWWARLGFASVAIGRTGLALLCVLLFRSARDRRPIRPAEMLLAIVAGPELAEAADASPLLSGSVYHVPFHGQPNSYQTIPGAPFWWTHAAVVSAGIGAAVVLHLARRHLPPLATSLLLVAIALSSSWIVAPSAHAMYGWRAMHPVSLTTGLILKVIQRAISELIPAMVAIVAIRDLLLRRWSLGTLEWIGLSLTSAWFLIPVASALLFVVGGGGSPLVNLATVLQAVVGPLTAFVLGMILVAVSRRVFDPPNGMTPPLSPGQDAGPGDLTVSPPKA